MTNAAAGDRDEAGSWLRRAVGLLLPMLLSLFGAPVLAGTALSLSLSGPLVEQRVWSAAELGRLPQTEIVVTHAVASGQEQEASKTTYRGVLLRDLLQAAKLHEEARHDFRRMVVVARASDGYVALFTWAELFNAKAGDSVLVSIDTGSQPEPSPSLTLRSFGDIRPGPRHVKMLEQIEIVKIANQQ